MVLKRITKRTNYLTKQNKQLEEFAFVVPQRTAFTFSEIYDEEEEPQKKTTTNLDD
jgi:hypothetical protein